MDNLLIFSAKQLIKCIDFATQTKLILASNEHLYLFDIGEAIELSKYHTQQKIMPIGMWVVPQQSIVVLQGKMGHNYVYKYNTTTYKFEMATKYQTHIHGFCKMYRYLDKIFGISEDHKAIYAFDILNGAVKYKAKFQDEKVCESTTCIQITRSQNKENGQKLDMWMAQQGGIIYKFQLQMSGSQHISQQQQILVQATHKTTLQINRQIKIITCLISSHPYLYALCRKSPLLSILSITDLHLIKQQNKSLSNGKNLTKMSANYQKIECKENSKGNQQIVQFIVTDGNKIIKVGADGNGVKTVQLGQIVQSKIIQYVAIGKYGICGCTAQNQFFYLQL